MTAKSTPTPGKRSWRQRAKELKRDTIALYLAYRDPRTPWYAKLWIAAVTFYAFSPIDLIPDVIPVLGYLDDLILVPAGVAIALKMVPADVMAEYRLQAQAQQKPTSRLGAALIVAIWIAAAGALIWHILR